MVTEGVPDRRARPEQVIGVEFEVILDVVVVNLGPDEDVG